MYLLDTISSETLIPTKLSLINSDMQFNGEYTNR